MTISPLAAYHKAQMEDTRRKIRDAMTTIAAEIAAHPDKEYTHSKRGLSQSEICRRAGVSRSVPKQPHQKILAEEMRAFLARTAKTTPTTQKAIQERRKESMSALQRAFQVLAADVLVHKQRAENLQEENIRLQRLLDAERARNASAASKVVPLPTRQGS